MSGQEYASGVGRGAREGEVGGEIDIKVFGGGDGLFWGFGGGGWG